MAQFANMDPALSINPGAAQVDAFLALDQDQPVVFVNLHEYHERARYPRDHVDPRFRLDVSGREAYRRYLDAIESRFLPQVGARFLVVAPTDVVMVGEGRWQEAVIGWYPTRAAALRLPGLPGYEQVAVHRHAGLKAALTLALGPEAMDRLRP